MRDNLTQYELLSPDQLIPTEEIEHASVIELEHRILDAGKWTAPVAVHIDALFVMDGHHRLTVAKRLRLRALPVVLLDYRDVDVTAWRDGELITPEDICKAARDGRLFPPKTTRHLFKHPLPHCDFPLAYLKQCELSTLTTQNNLSRYRQA